MGSLNLAQFIGMQVVLRKELRTEKTKRIPCTSSRLRYVRRWGRWKKQRRVYYEDAMIVIGKQAFVSQGIWDAIQTLGDHPYCKK